MAAEQTLTLYPDWLTDPKNIRRVAACGAALIAVLGFAARCDGNTSSRGGSSIDTDGTKGSGYRPGGRDWDGTYRYPQGAGQMPVPGAEQLYDGHDRQEPQPPTDFSVIRLPSSALDIAVPPASP